MAEARRPSSGRSPWPLSSIARSSATVRRPSDDQTVARLAPEWRATLLSASLTIAEQVRGRRRPSGSRPDRRPTCSSTSIIELCRNSSTSAASAVDQRRPAQELRPQAEDEVADVPDRRGGGCRSPARPAARPRRDRRAISSGHVLERQPDGVDALDDPVVEVLADPLALVDDRQPLDLLVQPGVLDGDPGVDARTSRRAPGRPRRTRRRRPCRSGRGCRPSGPCTVTGTPRKLCIGGWCGGKPVAPRVDGDVRDPERSGSRWMIRPRNPWPRGRGPILARVSRSMPARDEALDHAVGVDDAEGRVARPDQRPDLVDDDLQDVVDGVQPAIARVAASRASTTLSGVALSRSPLTRDHGSRVPVPVCRA